MAKKKSNVYFNLFNVEDYNFEQDEYGISEEAGNDQDSFFSIAGIEEKPTQSDELSGQLTMFTEESLEQMQSNVSDEDTVFKTGSITEKITTIEEPIIETKEAIISEEKLKEESAQEFFVEAIIDGEIIENTAKKAEGTTEETDSEEAKKNEEEEMLVSLLETNALDQEFNEETVEKGEEIKENTANGILSDIPDFKAIKKQKIFDDFETPYVYHGKNGDRIRYRLSLPTDNDAKRNRAKKATAGWIITVALALLLAIVIRTFVFVVATVDGPSMQPTLTSNDRLFVTKFTYTFTDIERGDVVICRYNTIAYPDMYVKRVIGLPGETISIIDGVVYINGAELNEDYTLPSAPYSHYYNMDAVYIPNGYVFVMGDNRNNSADSRMESIGPISIDNIIGKAQARIFPFTSMCILEEDN